MMERPRVLVVDDELSVRMAAQALLNAEGYQVFEASNGKEALERVASADPDAILLDVKMPVMDGIQTCKTLKADKKTRNIPVLAITAAGETKEEMIKAGTDDFLTKPFETDELTVRVRAMLKMRTLTNDLERVVAYVNEFEKQRQIRNA